MIGPLGNLNADLIAHFFTRILPVALAGLAAGGALGWALARMALERTADRLDMGARWLQRLPLVPLLVLGAAVLPVLELPPLVEIVLVAALIALPAALVGLRYQSLHLNGRTKTQLQLDRRAVLRTGWRDTALVLAAFVASGFAYRLLVPAARDEVSDALAHLPGALIIGLAGGFILGSAASTIYQRASAALIARHERGVYSRLVDGFLGTLNGMIPKLLTQFHATPLAGVLIITAAALPFTRLPQLPLLAVMVLVPAASAVLAGNLVEDPQPNEPDRWHHWRSGLANVAQIGIGHLVGSAMLIPLAAQHAWMLSDSHEVLRQLNTHLELTFYALGISIALGMVAGILASRVDLLRTILTNLGNLGRTIPSLAVLALALPIFGVGRDPSLVALVFIGTLPILVNTTVGIINVSPEIKEAARGMGMSDPQVLLRVEVPIAIPVIMAGVRTSAVLVVASATLAGFIGGGGLGALIIRGDGSGREDILITGAVLATILSIFLEYFFGWLETLLTPRGLREA